MKKSGAILFLLVFLAVTAAIAQSNPPQSAAPQVALTNARVVVESPTENDMYCSGFISATPVSRNSYVAAGWEHPFQTHYSDKESDYIYLTGGSYEPGQRYHILRAVREDIRFEAYKGQFAEVRKTGQPYAEVGRVRVVEVQKGIGISVVEFACDPILTGDLAIPWQEREVPKYRHDIPLNRFAQPNGKLTGRIVMGKDFDVLSGMLSKVYINVGSNQGVKPGDYFAITRTHSATMADQVDILSNKASLVDTKRVDPPKFPKTKVGDLPRRTLGQAIVLYTTPTTSTIMIDKSLESIYAGDYVEMLELPPPPPPPPPPAMNPPTITCTASPAAIKVGETSTIRCTGASPDDRPLTYAFNSDNGTVAPRDNTAVFDSRSAHPGLTNVQVTATDDRNLSASTVARINVEAAPVPTVADMGSFLFKPLSARVDNAAKALLDGVAMRMQREPGSHVVIVGYTTPKEAASLAMARATNAQNYLVKEKGVDGTLVRVADGGAGGDKATVWFVPNGAPMPTVTPIPRPAAKAPAKPAAKAPAASAAKKPASTSTTKPKN